MQLRNAKRMFVIIFIIFLLFGCQAQSTTTLETTLVSTTEVITYDLPYDVYFDMEIDVSKDERDLLQTLSELKAIIEPYGREKLYSDVDEYVESNISIDERIYIDDLEYFEAFDAYLSKNVLFHDQLMYMISILEDEDVELGVLKTVNTDYYTFDFGCIDNDCDPDDIRDVEVMALLGEKEIYADIWLLNEEGELEKRSVFQVLYDDQGIVEMNLYEFDALLDDYLDKNEFNLIDYTRGEGGLILTTTDYVSGVRALDVIIIDEQDNYAAYSYSSNPNRMGIFKVNVEDEYFFWTLFDQDYDYRNISIYEDDVFKVGYRYMYEYDIDHYLYGNNYIHYNLKDIDNVSYVENYELFYVDTQDNLQSMPYSNIYMGRFYEPTFSPSIRYLIESEISQSLYENPLDVLEYDDYPYEEFMSIWNSIENIWDEFYIDQDLHLQILRMDINLKEVPLDFLPDFTYNGFNVFIEDIDERYPDAIYR